MTCLDAWRKRRKRARDRAELMQMDDTLLADLGIARHEIDSYLDGTVPRRGAAQNGPRPDRTPILRVIEGGATGLPLAPRKVACC
ncbi:MAG: DUF1127 domain-containing protein [Pseudomonadota bacterium]